MRCAFSLLLFLLTSGIAVADQNIDVTSKYIGRDFSRLIVPKTEFLGYIGGDYQRLRIFFVSVSQDKKDHSLYRVNGYSEVKGIRCDFGGTINVKEISRLRTMHYGVDDEFRKARLQAQGAFSAKYEFRENPKQRNSGAFAGVMTLNWYIDRHGKLLYDNIEIDSDGFSNNQYIGTWSAYGFNTKSVVANWGEYRIPSSGDLDIGAAEFSANPKYRKQGW